MGFPVVVSEVVLGHMVGKLKRLHPSCQEILSFLVTDSLGIHRILRLFILTQAPFLYILVTSKKRKSPLGIVCILIKH